jgi:hypothetical protein
VETKLQILFFFLTSFTLESLYPIFAVNGDLLLSLIFPIFYIYMMLSALPVCIFEYYLFFTYAVNYFVILFSFQYAVNNSEFGLDIEDYLIGKFASSVKYIFASKDCFFETNNLSQ